MLCAIKFIPSLESIHSNYYKIFTDTKGKYKKKKNSDVTSYEKAEILAREFEIKWYFFLNSQKIIFYSFEKNLACLV